MSLNNWLPAVNPPAICLFTAPPFPHTASVIPKNPFGFREIGRSLLNALVLGKEGCAALGA